jgi:hypothetical protein
VKFSFAVRVGGCFIYTISQKGGLFVIFMFSGVAVTRGAAKKTLKFSPESAPSPSRSLKRGATGGPIFVCGLVTRAV